MTNQHPLTDDILGDIWKDVIKKYDEKCESWFEDKLMRAAADWQLERDAEYFAKYLVDIFGLDPEIAQLRAEWFKEAMRPQQQLEDN